MQETIPLPSKVLRFNFRLPRISNRRLQLPQPKKCWCEKEASSWSRFQNVWTKLFAFMKICLIFSSVFRAKLLFAPVTSNLKGKRKSQRDVCMAKEIQWNSMAKKVCCMEKAYGMLSILSIAKHNIKSIQFYDMVKLAIMNRKIYPNLAIDQTWKFFKNLRILLCFVYLLEHVVRVWWFEICFWNLANFTWKIEKNHPEKTVMLWCSHFCLKDENFVNVWCEMHLSKLPITLKCKTKTRLSPKK